MITPKVLVTDLYDSNALLSLQVKLKCEILHSQNLQPTKEELTNCDALLIRSGTKIDQSLMKLAPRLKIIVSATSGFDHIDFNSLAEYNVAAFHTPDANAASAAELTFLLLLSLCRNTPQLKDANSAKKWRSSVVRGSDLYRKDLGLIGLGRVGQRVARMAKAFDMNVMAYDPYIADDIFKKLDIRQLGLTEVFCESQILSLHVPLTHKTRHLINKHTIEYMSEETLLINASRGAVVNESDLVLALQQGNLAGAALDVFEREPLSHKSQLLNLPQVYLTPHIGAYTKEALTRASFEAVEKLVLFFQNNNERPIASLETNQTQKTSAEPRPSAAFRSSSIPGELPPQSPWFFDER